MSTFPTVYSRAFIPYQPPNEGAGLLTCDRDICWRVNPRGLVNVAVIGVISWAHNHLDIPEDKHRAILDGLGLEYHHLPSGARVLRPQLEYRQPPPAGRSISDLFSLANPQMPLHHYDNIEVYGCVETQGCIERFESNEHPDCTKPALWSVALHLALGHIEVVADFPEESQAEAFGEIMREVVLAAREAEGLASPHLQPPPIKLIISSTT